MTRNQMLTELTILQHLNCCKNSLLLLDKEYDEGSMEKLKNFEEIFEKIKELSSIAENISNNS